MQAKGLDKMFFQQSRFSSRAMSCLGLTPSVRRSQSPLLKLRGRYYPLGYYAILQEQADNRCVNHWIYLSMLSSITKLAECDYWISLCFQQLC